MNNYPILAPNSTWFAPTISTVTRPIITEIEIMDSYTPDASVTVMDSWDASEAKDGSITCYVIGTKLIIAGNGSGMIAANEDSRSLFADSNSADYYDNVTAIKNLTLLDTSNVVEMNAMFSYCKNITSLDLSDWNTGKVSFFNSMFYGCSNLTRLDVSKWDTSSATQTTYMFANCEKLTSLGLFDLKIIDGKMYQWGTVLTDGMFSNIPVNMELLSTPKWDVSGLPTADYLFKNWTSIPFDVNNIIGIDSLSSMKNLFGGYKGNIINGDMSHFVTDKVTSTAGMFSGCTNLQELDTSNWDTSSCTIMEFMFHNCSSLAEIDVSNWDVSKVTSFDHFAAHAGLRRKGIENWNTSSATNMNAMFHNCAEEELDLSGFDTSKVQFFCQMFENSPNLKRIKGLEKWDTSAGLGFDEMFERCYVLEELDLSSFNTSKAKNGVKGSINGHKTATLQNMFLSCNNLKKVTVGPNFSINGNGSNTAAANKAILPTPSTDYIDGADGMWYNFTGDSYAPNAMKDKTAETYYASYDIVADIDVIVKNGSLIDTARAIRIVKLDETKYTPSQFKGAVNDIEEYLESTIDRSMTELKSNAKEVGDFAFYSHPNMTSVYLPLATRIGQYSFSQCKTLSSVYAPLVTTIDSTAFYGSSIVIADFPLLVELEGKYVFANCEELTTINLPSLISIALGNDATVMFGDNPKLKTVNIPKLTCLPAGAFQRCKSLTTIDLPSVTSIGELAFSGCTNLSTIILRSEVMVTAEGIPCGSTPIASGTGYIYVPSALVDAYKTATNWSTYANQFRALEDYTVDGTITGELDESKI